MVNHSSSKSASAELLNEYEASSSSLASFSNSRPFALGWKYQFPLHARFAHHLSLSNILAQAVEFCRLDLLISIE